MLDAMCRDPGLGAAHPDKRAFGDIVVDAVDVGIGMVNDIVFLFPDEIIAAKRIERKSKELVDPFTGRIAAVVGVVHHVEADTGEYKTEEEAAQGEKRPGHRDE